MIVRDEEHNLPRCLESVRDVVAEVIVVDTGSVDQTFQVAEKAGAKVLRFPWNHNFSEARNQALAAATGDWILILDADETLAPGSVSVLRRIVEEPAEGYIVKIINFIGSEGDNCPDLVFRLFRNRPAYQFHGAIHEQIMDVILAHNQQAVIPTAEDLVILHHGYLRSQIAQKDKISRNMAIIEHELAKKPHNQSLRYQYGLELFRLGRFSEALAEFKEAAKGLDARTMYFPKLLRSTALVCYELKDYAQAMGVIKHALGLFPDYADLYYYGGLICREQKIYPQALDLFKQALASPPQPTNYASLSGTKGYRSYYEIGRLAEEYGNEEEALRYYLLSMHDNPRFTAAMAAIVHVLNPREDAEYTRRAMEKLCDFCTPAAKLLIGRIYFAEAAYQLALDYFSQAGEGGLTSADLLLKALCLIQLRRFSEALALLDAILPTDAQYAAVQVNKLFCYRLAPDHASVGASDSQWLARHASADVQRVAGLLGESSQKTNLAEPVFLGEEGLALVKDILRRALALGEENLAEGLLARLNQDLVTESALEFGEIFGVYGFFAQAENMVQQYLRSQGNCPRANFQLAEILRRQDRLVEAEYYYRQTLTADPREPRYYIKLIGLYKRLRQNILAEAVQKDPGLRALSDLFAEETET